MFRLQIRLEKTKLAAKTIKLNLGFNVKNP